MIAAKSRQKESGGWSMVVSSPVRILLWSMRRQYQQRLDAGNGCAMIKAGVKDETAIDWPR